MKTALVKWAFWDTLRRKKIPQLKPVNMEDPETLELESMAEGPLLQREDIKPFISPGRMELMRMLGVPMPSIGGDSLSGAMDFLKRFQIYH